MAQGRELERLFITLVADDSGLRSQLERTRGIAKNVAEDLSRAFEQGASRSFEQTGARVEASARRQKQAIDPIKVSLEAVKNETASLRNTTEAGSTSTQDAIRRFTELRDESLRLAQGLDVTSKEYRGFTQAAAQASRSIKTLEGETTKLGFSANNAVGVSAALRQNIGLLGPAANQAARGLGLVQTAFTGFAATGPGVTGQLDGIVRGLGRLQALLPLIAVAAGGAAIAGLVRFGNAAAKVADEIDKGARSAGLSAEAYQELRFAFDQNGVSAERFDTLMQGLNQRLGQAAQGSRAQADAFARLGVEIRDASGNIRGTEEVLRDVIQGLSDLPSAAERAAAGMEVLGRTGRELGALLDTGVEGIDALRASAREMGLVVSGDAIISLVEYKDTMATLQRQFETARIEIAAGFIPVLTDVLIPLLQNTIVPVLQNAAERVRAFAEQLADTGEGGRIFRSELAASLTPLVAIGQTAVAVGASVVGAFQTMIAGAVQLSTFLGTVLAEIEQDTQRGFGNIALSVADRISFGFGQAIGVVDRESSVLERASAVAREAAQAYYESALSSFELAGNAFTFDLEELLNEIAESTNRALERGAGSLFGEPGSEPGGGASRAFLQGSLAALQQELERARQAYREAGDAAGRAFQAGIIESLEAAISAIEAEIERADPFAGAQRWVDRLGKEFTFGLKSAVEVFDILNPRAEELRAQIAGLLQAGDFDTVEVEVLIGKLEILERLLARIERDIDVTVTTRFTYDGPIGPQLPQVPEWVIDGVDVPVRFTYDGPIGPQLPDVPEFQWVFPVRFEYDGPIGPELPEVPEWVITGVDVPVRFEYEGAIGPELPDVPEFDVGAAFMIRQDLATAFEAAAVAASVFGRENEFAAEKVRLVEGAMTALIALDPAADISDLVALWRELGVEADEISAALLQQAEVTSAYESALQRLATLAGDVPSEFEQLRAAFEAAARQAIITTEEFEKLIQALNDLESAGQGDADLRAITAGFDIGSDIVDGIADTLSSIRIGDLPGVLSGLTSLGAAIGTAIGGPAVGALVASVGGFLQSLGRLFGIGRSAVPESLERTRAPGAAARGAPSVQLTFQQFNTAQFESLGDPRLGQLVDDIAARTIDVLERVVLPRLTAVEERLA